MRSSDRPASFARRVLPAIALTGISGVLLTQLDRPQAALSIGVGLKAPTLSGAAKLGGTGTADPTSGTTAAHQTSSTGTASPDTGPRSTQPTHSSVPATPTKCTGPQYTGPVADTRWGPVQVVAVVSKSGAICAASSTGPNSHRRSIFINDQALPILNQEAVAQGVNFDSVSGATVTSRGYRQSLQALLDAAKK